MKEMKLTVGQKIDAMIKERGFKSLHEFRQKIVEAAGEDAITYSSLWNAVNITKKPHVKTLEQIAYVLKTEISELLKGTTSEPPDQGPTEGFITYTTKTATLHNLYHGLPAKPQVIKIDAYGETSIEEDKIPGAKECIRFIYIIRGSVELVLNHKGRDPERRALNIEDTFCFDSTIPHYFKNANPQFAKIFVINYKK
jgi:hypothetical protein